MYGMYILFDSENEGSEFAAAVNAATQRYGPAQTMNCCVKSPICTDGFKVVSSPTEFY